jgi:hypothetical protein
MTAYQLATTAFYASLVAFALFATWPHEAKRQVGVMLLLCWAASNIIFWTLPLAFRPSIFPILDVLFALTCAKAGKETGSRVPLALIALSVLAIAANTAFSISGGVHYHQARFYEIILNVVFALQALVTGAWGIADAVGRSVRFTGLARHLWGYPQSNHHSNRAP